MSLILEALRKSEAERRRGLGPDLHAELPPLAAPARRSKLSRWMLWLPLLFVVLALSAWWRTSRHDVAPTPPVTAQVAQAAPMMPAVPRLVRQAQSAPPPDEPRPTVSNNKPVPAIAAVATPKVAAVPAHVPAPIPNAANPVAPPPTPDRNGDHTLLLSDLAPGERKALPPLKLSMHLWDEDPARRFVILDGDRLHEGDRIGDLVVTAITRDGVVLDWNGRALQLPIR